MNFRVTTSVFFFLVLFSVNVFAQSAKKENNGATVVVSGTVKDAETNATVAGVTISQDGKNALASTKGDGTFSVTVAKGALLVFTAVSYLEQRVKVTANENQIEILLTHESKELEGVVVTALGITRKQKALGYAVQNINNSELTDAKSNNWSSALSGKVAGLSLLSPGSGPFNSTRISLRGDVSLNPDGNNALIVIDGIPKNSGLTSSGVNNAYGAGSGNDIPVDFGNGIADLNPDDIESITVLKGPG
ncbi:MAG: TonB-dependent receptor plug domain-containing protein, partial [Chitinophagaceae bacterium]|nr:TonB-dependent receptor plug domain-containing protein [Chitinophagaceae bacterium]